MINRGTGISVFRVDNPHTKPFAFWEWFIAEREARWAAFRYAPELASRSFRQDRSWYVAVAPLAAGFSCGAREYGLRQGHRMDIIFLHNLKVDAVIGIWEWERKIRQTVEIDLDMAADIRKAAESDDVEDTLNYKLVAKRLQAFIGESEFQLVETLAERIAGIITGEFGVPWVRVRVNKPGAIRGARDVGVVIERGEKPGRE